MEENFGQFKYFSYLCSRMCVLGNKIQKQVKNMESIQEAYDKLINKEALEYIIENHPLMKWADKELKLAGYNAEHSNSPAAWMYRQVMEDLALFYSHDNSGNSAPYERDLFSKLTKFSVLSPLTFKEDEWVDCGNGKWQNKRDSSVFKDKDGSVYDIDAFAKRPLWRKEYNSNDFVANPKASCWRGSGLYEYDTYYSMVDGHVDDGVQKFTGRYLARANFTKEDIANGVLPYDPIIVHCAEIEVLPDNWIMMVNASSDDVLELEKHYDLVWKEVECVKDVECFKVTPELLKEAEKELKK